MYASNFSTFLSPALSAYQKYMSLEKEHWKVRISVFKLPASFVFLLGGGGLLPG